MQTTSIKIEDIPAILWGGPSDRLFIAVHGHMSSKTDRVIELLAEAAARKGYRTLSFDLPEHGDRKLESRPCTTENCVADLSAAVNHGLSLSKDISLFGCSMGAYFSLLACGDIALRQALFLSPVVDMERLIRRMMAAIDVSESRLEREKRIPTPFGQTLDWDYYSYVKARPIAKWKHPTAILSAEDDKVSEPAAVASFAKKFNCKLRTIPDAEHYFHTEVQLAAFSRWLNENIA